MFLIVLKLSNCKKKIIFFLFQFFLKILNGLNFFHEVWDSFFYIFFSIFLFFWYVFLYSFSLRKNEKKNEKTELHLVCLFVFKVELFQLQLFLPFPYEQNSKLFYNFLYQLHMSRVHKMMYQQSDFHIVVL